MKREPYDSGFIKKGFQHYAFFWIRPHWRSFSYADRIKEEGYECQILFTPDKDTSSHSLHEWLQGELKKLPKPVAIFCPDDNTAAEVIEASVDAAYRVPEDVSVLGTHNDEIICENLVVPLSSVGNDFERQGYETAALLQKLMKVLQKYSHITIIWQVRIRYTLKINEPVEEKMNPPKHHIRKTRLEDMEQVVDAPITLLAIPPFYAKSN